MKGDRMERLTIESRGVLGSTDRRCGKRGLETPETGGVAKATAMVVRIVTAPHFMAILLSTVLYIGLGHRAFANASHYIEALFTLGFLPMLPYALCMIIPSLRKKGRKLERTLAIAFSVLGYVMGTLFALLGGGTAVEKVLFLTYLFSGVLTALLSFVVKFRASGHTCGVSGPAAMLVYYLGPAFIPFFALLVPVFLSSLRLKRHSIAQLIAGCVVPIVSMIAALLIIGGI